MLFDGKDPATFEEQRMVPYDIIVIRSGGSHHDTKKEAHNMILDISIILKFDWDISTSGVTIKKYKGK